LTKVLLPLLLVVVIVDGKRAEGPVLNACTAAVKSRKNRRLFFVIVDAEKLLRVFISWVVKE
jgi:hypothetical protein